MMVKAIQKALDLVSRGEMDPLLDRYERQLESIDACFSDAIARGEARPLCEPGCCECCRGIFEISVLDALLIARRGLKRAFPKTTYKQAEKLSDRVTKASWPYPHLFQTIEEYESPPNVEELDDTPCPLLDGKGRCRIYKHRPSICRFQGIPFVDPQSGQELEDECPKASPDRHRIAFNLFDFNSREMDLFSELCGIIPEFRDTDLSGWDTLIASSVLWSLDE